VGVECRCSHSSKIRVLTIIRDLGLLTRNSELKAFFFDFRCQTRGILQFYLGPGITIFRTLRILYRRLMVVRYRKYARTQAGNDVHKYIDPLTLNDPCFFMFCSGTGDSIRETVRGSKYV
jgi:hypothetical protein